MRTQHHDEDAAPRPGLSTTTWTQHHDLDAALRTQDAGRRQEQERQESL